MRFILTPELGRLAKWLRIVGLDAVYYRENSHAELIINALREERIILTRDERIGENRGVRLIKIRHDGLKEQLQQVLTEFSINIDEEKLFKRCVLCNAVLEPAAKQSIRDMVSEYIYETHDEFMACPGCHKVYWQGTHWGNVKEILNKLNV